MIGDDSSMCDIVPEDFAVGQDVGKGERDSDDFNPVQAWAHVCVCALVFNKKV